MSEKKVFKGDLIAKPRVVYDFDEVTGSVDASGADTKTAFPNLTSVGGYVDARGADTKTAFPKLTSVGGSVDARGADTKTAFPKLTSVGGYVDASGDWSHVKQNDSGNGAASRCAAALMAAFSAAGFSFVDGILARVVSQRGNVARVVVAGMTKQTYLVTDGSAWSHGDTLKSARDGLFYKVGERDTSEFKTWKLDSKVTKRDAIRAYRTITGACESGVRGWMEQRETPDHITVSGVIEMTRGAFGSDAFAKFFNG